MYVGTGFSEPKEMIFTFAGYILILGIPLAITYIATGFSGSLVKQAKLSALALIIILSGGFIVYGPAVSYLAIMLAVVSFVFSVHQVVNRHRIEGGI